MRPRRRQQSDGPPAILIDRLIRSYDEWLDLLAHAGHWTPAQRCHTSEILHDWRYIMERLAEGRYSRAAVEEAVAAAGRQDLLDRDFLAGVLVSVKPELPPLLWVTVCRRGRTPEPPRGCQRGRSRSGSLMS